MNSNDVRANLETLESAYIIAARPTFPQGMQPAHGIGHEAVLKPRFVR